MSMTREEAINTLKKRNVSPNNRVNEAIEVTISSLRPVSRERVEKVWKGEWKLTEYPYMNECEDCSVCGYRTTWGHGFRFCPACGRAMTDEAVEMVMERMEALHGETD